MATSIVDYNSLLTAIANWMTRTGNADFTSNLNDFVAFCEDRINYGSDDPEFPSPPLRVDEMEVPATTITILVSSNTVALPPDFLEMRRIFVNTSGSITNINKLIYLTPNNMDTMSASIPQGPPDIAFTIMGGQLVLAHPLASTETVTMGYYAKLPALSTSNTVNWLLTKRPNVYLTGAMLEASLFVGDDAGAIKWARVFTAHVRSHRKQDTKKRFSGDALQIKTDVGNP